MSQDGPFFSIVVETYYQPPKSGYRGGIRVRPVAGERFPAEMNVECSKKERERHPIGTRLRIRVKVTDRDGSNEFLMADTRSNYEVVP
jgi:hypothetical protein